MARYRLDLVRKDLSDSLDLARNLLDKANLFHSQRPKLIKSMEHESIVAKAFLDGIKAWEGFLEASFILFLMGKKSPSGSRARGSVHVRTYVGACDFLRKLFPRNYVRWTDVGAVINLANLYFDRRDPFNAPLRSVQIQLEQMHTIRNAIAHGSLDTRGKFEKLVESITYQPAFDISPASFLLLQAHRATPPSNYFEHYFNILQLTASLIVT